MAFTYFTLIASYLALFFAVCELIRKKKHISDYYLTIWLLVLSAFMFCKLEDSQLFVITEKILSALHGIILFLYIKSLTSQSRFLLKDLLHLTPFVLIVFPVFFISGYVFTIAYQLLSLVLFFIYIALSAYMVFKYKRSIKEIYSTVKDSETSWLNILIYGGVFFVTNYILELLFSAYPAEIIEYIALFIFMNIVGIKGVFRTMNFVKPPLKIEDNAVSKVSYSNYGLKQTEAEKLSERLNEYMKNEKPYLNPSLSLKDFAKAMNTYPHYITQVLNTVLNQNFYDFVNEYRIEEAERQLTAPSKSKFTILSIAFDCGFNSKATFNRVFKEKKGVTPTKYKNAIYQ